MSVEVVRRQAWLLWSIGLLAVAGILFIADDVDASSVSVSPGTIAQGGSVTITVNADATEIIAPPDIVRVTLPDSCKYTSPVADGVAVTYPGNFQADSANNPACPENPHTRLSGVSTQLQYRVDFIPSGTNSQPSQNTFKVIFTDKANYQRTEKITIDSRGFAPNTPVTFQIDLTSSGNTAFHTQQIQSAADGSVKHTYTIPQGQDGSIDIGTWTLHLFADSGTKRQDKQTITVAPTTLAVQWVSQPDDTRRTELTGAEFRLVYTQSESSQRAGLLDIDGGVVDLEFQWDSNSATWVVRESAQATFDDTGNVWKVTYRPQHTETTLGDFRFSVVGQTDRYGNAIGSLQSSTFDVLAGRITPVISVETTTVERESTTNPFTARVELRFPSGQAVKADDLPSSSPGVALHVYAGNTRVSDSTSEFLALPTADGIWRAEGQVAKAWLQLGTLTVRVGSPTVVNGNLPTPNTIVTATPSNEFTLVEAKPTVTVNFFRIDPDSRAREPTTGLLRGEELFVEAQFNYDSGRILTEDDIHAQGFTTGHAFVRVTPNRVAAEAFDLTLTYQPSSKTWTTSRVIEADRPVGTWYLTTHVQDSYGNNNQKEKAMRVGIDLVTLVSHEDIKRGETLSVDVQVDLPTPSSSATVEVSITGPTLLADKVTIPPKAGNPGAFGSEFIIPVDAPLGQYRVEVTARTSVDSGLEVVPFNVQATGISIDTMTRTAEAVKRLESVGASFGLKLPGGLALEDDDVAQLTVKVIDSTGAVVKTLQPQYTAGDKRWNVSWKIPLAQALGNYNFRVEGEDSSGNEIAPFVSAAVKVEPATIRITELATTRLGFDRGETITVIARAKYVDGSQADVDSIAARVLAGSQEVKVINLDFDQPSGRYVGTYAIKLSDPVSSPAATWKVEVAAGSVTDGAGNVGPIAAVRSNDFAVDPALLSVFIDGNVTGQLEVGKGPAVIKFRLKAADGTPVNVTVQSIVVNVTRAGSVIGQADLSQSGGIVTASFPLGDGVVPGNSFRFIIEGADESGNRVVTTQSPQWSVEGAAKKESPGLPLLAVLGVMAWAVRRRL